MLALRVGALLVAARVQAYPNGAPNARLPTLGWSSWIGLGPGAEHPVFDYCDASGIMAAADAFIEVGLFDAGYRHFHLDVSSKVWLVIVVKAAHLRGMKPFPT